MIQLLVNGELTNCKETRLDDFLQKRNKEEASFAVAVNEFFIPKSEYQSVELKNGDNIELLVPMQGG